MKSFVDELTQLALSQSRRPLSPALTWVMLSNGAADLNDNVIFFGFEGNQREPALVAKVPRLPSNGWIVRTEYERLAELWKFLGADAAQRLPEPIALFEIGGQSVLIISYVRGESLVYSAKKGLWRDSQRVLDLSLDAARSLRAVHDKAAVKLEDGEILPSDFARKVELFKQIYTPSEKEMQILSEVAERLRNNTPTHKTLIQGDFWHGNIIRGVTHNQLMFIDWQYSRWATDVSLDVYLFLMAGALASVPHGLADEQARATKDVLLKWCEQIIPAFLAAYGAADRFSLLPAKYGMLICCVEKAVRTVLDFGYNQSDDSTWRNLFSELINIPDDFGFYDGI